MKIKPKITKEKMVSEKLINSDIIVSKKIREYVLVN